MLHLQNNLCLPPIHELLSSKAYSHDTSSEKVKLAPLHNHNNNNDDAATNVISKERPMKESNTSPPPPQPIHPSSISGTKDYNYLPFSMENLALSSPSISARNSSNNTFQHRRSFSDTALMQTNNDPLRIIYRVSPSPPPPSSSSTSTTMTPTLGLKRSPSQPQRRYTCHYCDKSFIRPSSLRTHTYSHTGQKPFECAFEGCDKRFSVLSNMRRHMRRHRPSSSSSPASQE